MEKPIRILNVVGRMDRGGIETLIMNIYRRIDREKIQFDFLAHYGKEDADYNEEIRALGGRIYEMPVIKSTTKVYYYRFFDYIRALKKFFKEHPEYHVVHGHMTNTAAIYMPIAKRYGKVTCLIAHSHMAKTQTAVSKLAKWGTDLLRRPVRKHATDYFACSESASNWLFGHNSAQSGKVVLINNGVDADKFAFNPETRQRVRAALGLEDKTVIGHVGRFFHPKNHSFLLDIFAAYHEKNPESALLLVGDGELRAQCEAKAEKLGLRQCTHFLGVRGDVDELMQAMDLFLMPSLYEGLPVVGIEAQAAGLPLVVSTEISTELDVTGNVKFLSLDEDVSVWATAVENALKDHVRASTKEKMIASGYDIGHTVEFLEEFYINKHMQTKD